MSALVLLLVMALGCSRRSVSGKSSPTTSRRTVAEGPLSGPSGLAASTAVPAKRSNVREERDLEVDNAVERWRIEWRDTPQMVCLRWDCACSEFMYAQRGVAELVRSRGAKEIQAFPLAGIFDTDFDRPERTKLETLLPAWPVEAGDKDVADDATLTELVRSRELVSLMDLHDYDHDGRATEFLLPIGGVGCAFHGRVAIGVSRTLPELHIFGTVAHPEEPLVLRERGWAVLRTSQRGTYVDIACGDRGSDTQTEVELWTDKAGIHLIERVYSCPRTREHLVSRVER